MKFTKFYKPNCDPCKFLGKVLTEIDDPEFQLVEIDITEEDNRHYVQEMDIIMVPILLSETGNMLRGLKKPVITKQFIKDEIASSHAISNPV